MKVLTAEKMPNGDQHFVIEIEPATDDTEAVVEEFTWGSDVVLEDAKREMKLLLDSKYAPEPKQPKALKGMVGEEL